MQRVFFFHVLLDTNALLDTRKNAVHKIEHRITRF